VLGLVGFIEEESKEPHTLEHAGMIRSRIKRLDGFVKNILDFSRNKRWIIEPEEINFSEIINQTIEGLQHAEGAEKIDFVTHVDAAAPFHSDKQRIITMIENLVSNAIKYHNPEQEKQFIKITVFARKKEALISIEDNGIGMNEELLPKIFDMFYRISGAAPGSGLGLYLVKEIAEKLNGTVSVQSKPGAGSIFTITLKNLSNDNFIE
jgi:signal transduction histidine kinase